MAKSLNCMANFANKKSTSNNIWQVKMSWRRELRERNNIVKQVFPCLLCKFHNMWRIIFNHMHLSFMILSSPYCMNSADILILA